jgi:hypothetical protein
MRILLLQLDGKLPNLALMRIAAHDAAALRGPTHAACRWAGAGMRRGIFARRGRAKGPDEKG